MITWVYCRQQSPLICGDPFQDPQQTPEAVDGTEPSIQYVPSYPYTPEKKGERGKGERGNRE